MKEFKNKKKIFRHFFFVYNFRTHFCKVTAEHFKERAKYFKKTAKTPKSLVFWPIITAKTSGIISDLPQIQVQRSWNTNRSQEGTNSKNCSTSYSTLCFQEENWCKRNWEEGIFWMFVLFEKWCEKLCSCHQTWKWIWWSMVWTGSVANWTWLCTKCHMSSYKNFHWTLL